ncbi:uncharacterized protein BJ171DRAFT_509401 [Polychytrium aggregatum]|uniref:uncharacterized protein n=1 Tax=Polychytrium aggregatum TaxID=110093 RepID=UPI0022FE1E6D|nr:uncharacterized protein BJ171DRAFT_509401 [Polychytrium aggregatum]KAI9203719.1 hypothetical protein BJ171DRAFT_509401 [Polychytrium aggregatum]
MSEPLRSSQKRTFYDSIRPVEVPCMSSFSQQNWASQPTAANTPAANAHPKAPRGDPIGGYESNQWSWFLSDLDWSQEAPLEAELSLRPDVIRIPKASSLPFDEPTTTHLIECFFHMVQSVSAMCSYDDFFAEYNQPYHTEVFNLLVWVICTLMAQQSPKLKSSKSFDPIATQRRLMNHCESQVHKHLGYPHIQMVQSLILWGLICIDSADFLYQRSRNYVAVAYSMTIDIGFHLNPYRELGDVRQKSVRFIVHRNTFAMLYIMDRLSSFLTGRPVLIPEGSWDPSLVIKGEEEDIWNQFLYIIFRLCQISTQMLNVLNGSKALNTPERRRTVGRHALNELEHWWSTLPPAYEDALASLRPGNRPTWSLRHWLVLRFNAYIIIATRMTGDKVPMKLIRNVREIAGCLRNHPALVSPTQHVFQRSLMVHYAVLSITLLIDVILGAPTKEPLDHRDMVLLANDLNETLVFLENLHSGVVAFLRRLITKCTTGRVSYKRPIAVRPVLQLGYSDGKAGQRPEDSLTSESALASSLLQHRDESAQRTPTPSVQTSKPPRPILIRPAPTPPAPAVSAQAPAPAQAMFQSVATPTLQSEQRDSGAAITYVPLQLHSSTAIHGSEQNPNASRPGLKLDFHSRSDTLPPVQLPFGLDTLLASGNVNSAVSEAAHSDLAHFGNPSAVPLSVGTTLANPSDFEYFTMPSPPFGLQDWPSPLFLSLIEDESLPLIGSGSGSNPATEGSQGEADTGASKPSTSTSSPLG